MDRTSNIDTSTTTTNTNQFEIQSEEPNNKTLTMRKSSTPLNGSCLDGNVQHIQQQSQSHQQQHDEDSLFFVNKGLELWEKGRQEWLTQANQSNHHNHHNHHNNKNNGANTNGNGGGGVHKGAIDLNIDDVIDCIVSNRWRTALKGAKDKGTFATPVPLPQMIDILTDLWEAEGLDN